MSKIKQNYSCGSFLLYKGKSTFEAKAEANIQICVYKLAGQA